MGINIPTYFAKTIKERIKKRKKRNFRNKLRRGTPRSVCLFYSFRASTQLLIVNFQPLGPRDAIHDGGEYAVGPCDAYANRYVVCSRPCADNARFS